MRIRTWGLGLSFDSSNLQSYPNWPCAARRFHGKSVRNSRRRCRHRPAIDELCRRAHQREREAAHRRHRRDLPALQRSAGRIAAVDGNPERATRQKRPLFSDARLNHQRRDMPQDVFVSGEARWLGVQVAGQEEQPRVVLAAVPYSLKAADAETIGGLPASAFVLANGTNGSTTSVSAGTSSARNAGERTPAHPPVTGKGVVNFIPMWDKASDIVDSLIFQKSAQIGINTTSPAATFDVNGKSDIRDTLTLFPKGTDSTLAISGTTFKIDQTREM